MKTLSASFFAIIFMAPLLMGADSSYRNLDKRECPILDTPYRTMSGFVVGYDLPASTDASGWGKLSAYEVDAWVRCFDWENDQGGDLELKAEWNSMVLKPSLEGDSYPLTRAALFLQWSQRFEEGFGMQVNAAPGMYSAMQSFGGKDFSIPLGLTGIEAFSPDFAGFVGVHVYPTFHQKVDPILGVRWSDRDDVVLELAYPESRAEYSLSRNFRLVSGAGMSLWPEYNMGKDARERLRYKEGRAFGGIEWACSEYTVLSLQAGYLFARKISFESASDDVKIGNAPFFAIGIGGSL